MKYAIEVEVPEEASFAERAEIARTAAEVFFDQITGAAERRLELLRDPPSSQEEWDTRKAKLRDLSGCR